MSVTLTYKFAQLLRALTKVPRAGALVLVLALLLPVSANADQHELGFSKLGPPKSKFQLPNLGKISIWKNDMQAAKQAYRKGDYRKAQYHLHKALEHGNFLAAWYLGHVHRQGLGVPVNRGKAFHFYRKVALEYNDNAAPRRVFLIMLDSLVRVADGYRTGVKSGGVKRDYGRAMRLYTKAANRGHPAAQYGLANMFLTGQAGKKNAKKAVRWMKLAARKSFPPALAQLGEFSLEGKYVRKNKVRAVAMYIAATNGSNEDRYPKIFDRFVQLSRQLSDTQYQKAQNLSRTWIVRR